MKLLGVRGFGGKRVTVPDTAFGFGVVPLNDVSTVQFPLAKVKNSFSLWSLA